MIAPEPTLSTALQTDEIILAARQVTKFYPGTVALDHVDFNVYRGKVNVLVGENGAGKSTLMKILAGVYSPDAGEIEIYGRRRVFAHPAQALDAGVSMIYQELDLAEHLTVAENLYLGAEPRGPLPGTVSHRRMACQAEELARQYGFDLRPSAKVEDLATGDCQIVEILKALRRKASILVMDEPTSSLSESEARRLFEVVRRLRAQGLSIVYISHRLEEILELADEVSVLRDGRLVHSEPAAAMDIPKIVHHMVGRELTDFFPSRSARIGETLLQVRGLSSEAGIENVGFEVRRGEIVDHGSPTVLLAKYGRSTLDDVFLDISRASPA